MSVKKLQPTQFPLQFGGLNTASPPSTVYPDSPDLLNVRFGRFGEVYKHKDYGKFNTNAMPATISQPLGIFSLNIRGASSTRYVIVMTADKLFSLQQQGGAWTTLSTGLSGTSGTYGAWSDGAQFNNDMIVCNGVDAPLITNGVTAVSLTSQAAMQVKTSMTTAQSLTYGLHAVLPGTLIAACGASTAGGYDGATQSYDTIGDAWSTKTRAIQNRDDGPGFTAYGKVYVCTGLLTGPALTATCERYDPITDSWVGVTNITASRHQAVGNRGNSGGFVQTGDDNAGASAWTATNYFYDPALDAWSTKTAFTDPARRGAVGFPMSQSPHVASGRITAADAYDAEHMEYNPFTDAWTDLTDITAARSFAGGGEGDNNLGYVFGGFDSGGTAQPTIYSYNRVTDAWSTPAATQSTTRVISGVAADDWWLYSAGGAVGATASAVVDRFNTSPAAPSAYYVESFKSYLFLARSTTYPGRLWYSRAGDCRIWDPNAFIDVTPNDGGWITGLFVFNNRFYVTTNDVVYELTFSVLDPDPALGDQSLHVVSGVKGCTSNRSIVVTDHGVYYMSEEGAVLFDGARTTVISEKIPSLGDGSSIAVASRSSVGAWNRGKEEVWWSYNSTFGISGATWDWTTLIYNYRNKTWTRSSIEDASALAAIESTVDLDLMLFGKSTDVVDGYIYATDFSSTAFSFTLNGTAIDAYYQHGWFGLPMGVHDLSPSQLILYTERTGNHNLIVTFRRNYGTTDERTENVTLLSGSYPDSYFQDATDIRASIPFDGNTNGHAISVKYANATAAQSFSVYQAAILAHVPPVSTYP